MLSLRLGGMRRVLCIDAARRRVTVEPGLSLRELRRVLAAHDLTVGSWPMLLEQTVGGATLGAGHPDAEQPIPAFQIALSKAACSAVLQPRCCCLQSCALQP